MEAIYICTSQLQIQAFITRFSHRPFQIKDFKSHLQICWWKFMMRARGKWRSLPREREKPWGTTSVPCAVGGGQNMKDTNCRVVGKGSLVPMASSELSHSIPKGRAAESFKAASERLRNALPRGIRNHLECVDFPDFEINDGVEGKVDELWNVLESFVSARRKYKVNPTGSQVAKNTIRSCFGATCPFAQTFLAVVRCWGLGILAIRPTTEMPDWRSGPNNLATPVVIPKAETTMLLSTFLTVSA